VIKYITFSLLYYELCRAVISATGLIIYINHGDLARAKCDCMRNLSMTKFIYSGINDFCSFEKSSAKWFGENKLNLAGTGL
jgi:hypothetical protein